MRGKPQFLGSNGDQQHESGKRRQQELRRSVVDHRQQRKQADERLHQQTAGLHQHTAKPDQQQQQERRREERLVDADDVAQSVAAAGAQFARRCLLRQLHEINHRPRSVAADADEDKGRDERQRAPDDTQGDLSPGRLVQPVGGESQPKIDHGNDAVGERLPAAGRAEAEQRERCHKPSPRRTMPARRRARTQRMSQRQMSAKHEAHRDQVRRVGHAEEKQFRTSRQRDQRDGDASHRSDMTEPVEDELEREQHEHHGRNAGNSESSDAQDRLAGREKAEQFIHHPVVGAVGRLERSVAAEKMVRDARRVIALDVGEAMRAREDQREGRDDPECVVMEETIHQSLNSLMASTTRRWSPSPKSWNSGRRSSRSLTSSVTGQSPNLPPNLRPMSEMCSGK